MPDAREQVQRIAERIRAASSDRLGAYVDVHEDGSATVDGSFDLAKLAAAIAPEPTLTDNPEAVRARLRAFVLKHQHGGCRWFSSGAACTCALCDLERIEDLLAVPGGPLGKPVSRETLPRWDCHRDGPHPLARSIVVYVDGVEQAGVIAYDIEAGWVRVVDQEVRADGTAWVERDVRGVVTLNPEKDPRP